MLIVALGLLAVGIAIFPAVVVARLLCPDALPDTTLPNPNGYSEFLTAARLAATTQFNGNGTFEYDTAALSSLAAEVSKCDGVYDKIDMGLRLPSKVPVDYSISSDQFPVDDRMSLRTASRALLGKARLAALKGEPAEAASTYLQDVRYGHAICRGGLLVDMLIGNACGGGGEYGLYRQKDGLSASQLKETIEALWQLNCRDEPFDTFYSRDRAWSQRAYGWHNHLQIILEDITGDNTFDDPAIYGRANAFQRAIDQLLVCELAIAKYIKMNGRIPGALADLVPSCLDTVPINPLDSNGNSLRFIPHAADYILYSVGMNGIDDNGSEPGIDDAMGIPETGDLRLDSYYAGWDKERDEAQKDAASNSLNDVDTESGGGAGVR